MRLVGVVSVQGRISVENQGRISVENLKLGELNIVI